MRDTSQWEPAPLVDGARVFVGGCGLGRVISLVDPARLLIKFDAKIDGYEQVIIWMNERSAVWALREPLAVAPCHFSIEGGRA